MKIRKRLPDGSFGPLEEVFPESVDPTVLLLLEALAELAGQHEQIMQLEQKIE